MLSLTEKLGVLKRKEVTKHMILATYVKLEIMTQEEETSVKRKGDKIEDEVLICIVLLMGTR